MGGVDIKWRQPRQSLRQIIHPIKKAFYLFSHVFHFLFLWLIFTEYLFALHYDATALLQVSRRVKVALPR